MTIFVICWSTTPFSKSLAATHWLGRALLMLMLLLASTILAMNSLWATSHPILMPGDTILLKVLVYMTRPVLSRPFSGVGIGPSKLM